MRRNNSCVVFTSTTLASAGISCCRVSVHPSVTSRCSTETAKRWITQTTSYNSQTHTGSPPTEALCGCGWLKLATFDK